MSVEQEFSGAIDHFGLATTKGDYILKLHDSSTSPHALGNEDAVDENGNMVSSGYYVTGAGTPVECVYKLVSGSLDLSYIDPIGKGTDLIIQGCKVDTSNSDWPTLTVTGILYTSVPDTVPTFTWPNLTFLGLKRAQMPGFTAVGGLVRLTGSSYELAGDTPHYVLSDKDTVGNVDFTGAVLTATGDVVRISGAPVVEPSSPIATMTVTQPAGASAGLTSWATGSFGGRLVITPDVKD